MRKAQHSVADVSPCLHMALLEWKILCIEMAIGPTSSPGASSTLPKEKGPWGKGWSWAISVFKILPRYILCGLSLSRWYLVLLLERTKNASAQVLLASRDCVRARVLAPSAQMCGLHVETWKERDNGGRLNKSCDVVLKQLWSKGNMPTERKLEIVNIVKVEVVEVFW